MKPSKNRNYNSKIKESVSTEKKFNTSEEKPDKTKIKQNDLSRFNDPTITDQKKRLRDINKDLISKNEERIDEELNLINVQTDDEEDELDEEEEDKRNEEN